MKRLTTRTINGDGCPIQILTNQTYHNLCDRLADIEDILGDNYDLENLIELLNVCEGKTPAQIQGIFKEWRHYLNFASKQNAIEGSLESIYNGEEVGYDRLRNLVEADREGRCVIRPRTVWKIGPLWRPVEVKYRFWMRPLMGRWFFLTREGVLQHI